MKRTVTILLLLAVALILVSCNNTPKETTTLPTILPTDTQNGIPTETQTNIPETPADTTPMTSTIAEVTPTQSPEPTPTVAEKKIEKMDGVRNGELYTLNVTTKGLEGEELGVVVLTDEKYFDNWKENPDAVIDIAQFSVDDNGNGSITVTVPEDISEFFICVSYDGGNLIGLYM